MNDESLVYPAGPTNPLFEGCVTELSRESECVGTPYESGFGQIPTLSWG